MSKIEWTDMTWNPVVGCSRVSSGCDNCYAIREARRHDRPGTSYDRTTRTGKRLDWSGVVRCLPERLEHPLRWRKPRRVFVNSMSDLFHPSVPEEFIGSVFAYMAVARQHIFQVLTKRPKRMAQILAPNADTDWCGLDGEAQEAAERILSARGEFDPNARRHDDIRAYCPGWPLPNVHLGVSVEDQATADERIPMLLETPAAVRFVSYEPALGPVDFTHMDADAVGAPWCWINPLTGAQTDMGRPCPPVPKLDQIIVGGESGPGARPCDVAWIRSVVRQCREAVVPCFVKQIGSNPYYVTPNGASIPIQHITGKGGDPSEWPEDLRVREEARP